MVGDYSSEAAQSRLRDQMVEEQIVRRGIKDPAVLMAMSAVPRHLFMPEEYRAAAYEDSPMPIGYGQTISQPFVVASMTEHLQIGPRSRVLEVGTGSAYQTAILAEIAQEVFSIELVAELSTRAQALLRQLNYTNVQFAIGDGSQGWPEQAPFDAIIVTAAADTIPQPLIEQLGLERRMIIPVRSPDPEYQDLVCVTKTDRGVHREILYQVRFVPLRTLH